MLKVRKILTFAILSVFFVFIIIPFSIKAEEGEESNFFKSMGIAEGIGTHFEITGSDFLNIALDSTEEVEIWVSSIPEIISIEISSTTNSSEATEITLSGLAPETNYFKYEDSFSNLVEFTTDANGTYTYVQDLSEQHLIIIQTHRSTKIIKDNATGGACTLIGNWDPVTKTCTLTSSPTELISIEANGITLDGAGHTITGNNTTIGIYCNGWPDAVIKNFNINKFTIGIYARMADNILIENNNFLNNYEAIEYRLTENGVISNNTINVDSISSRRYQGLVIFDSDNNQIINSDIVMNTLSTNSLSRQGILIFSSNDNTFSNNRVSKTNHGVTYFTGARNLFINGTISENKTYGFQLDTANDNQIYNNNFEKNGKHFINFVPAGTTNSNIFNTALPYGGNYWDNYDTPAEGCNDLDNNNICDSFYKPLSTDGNDNYPWKIKDGWLTIPPPITHEPVLIIPGITGSYLNKNYDDGGEIWPNVSELLLPFGDEFLNDLALNTDGTENPLFPILLGDIIREEAGSHVFDLLVQELENAGYVEGTDLFVFPYDWRKSNFETAELLREEIEEILTDSAGDKVDIIAHSMGGIVAKTYLAENGADKIDQVIFLGTPHLGAPKTFKGLMYGDDMGFNTFFNLIGILNSERLKFISQNMPAVYELLPSEKFVNEKYSYVINALDKDNPIPLSYNGTKDHMLSEGRNPLMFPFAEDLHSAIDNLDLSAVEVHNFVGCGSKTVGEIKFSQKLAWKGLRFELEPDFDLRYVNGDETVPLVSADATQGANFYFAKEISHGTLPSADGVRQSIVSILEDEAPASHPDILADASSCNISGKNVSVHSPVELHIYDEAGIHTGPNEDGDIEINIPGVVYDILGENKFAFLPDGANYKIITKATDIGGYDFVIKDQDENDEITAVYEWNLIPLQTFETEGEIWVGPSYPAEEYKIKTDAQGDGFFEGSVSAGEEVDIRTYLQILRAIIMNLDVDDNTEKFLLVKLDKVEKELDKGKYEKMEEKLIKIAEKLEEYKGKLSSISLEEKGDLVDSINTLLDELI